MKIGSCEFREDLYYSKKHIWMMKLGNKVLLGLDDLLIKKLGTITDIEITYIDNELYKDDVMATIYYHGGIMEIFPPFAGKVTNVNEKLEDEPELLHEDPYGKGWLVEMENVSMEELDRQMQGDQAEDWFHDEVNID